MEDKRDYAWYNIMQSLEGAATYARMLNDHSLFGYERQTVLEFLEEFTKKADNLKQKYDILLHEVQKHG